MRRSSISAVVLLVLLSGCRQKPEEPVTIEQTPAAPPLLVHSVPSGPGGAQAGKGDTKPTLELKLAAIDAGHPVDVNDPVVQDFINVLSSLEQKCKSSRQQIYEVILSTHDYLAKRKGVETCLDIAHHLDAATMGAMDHVMKIEEVAGIYLASRMSSLSP